MENLELKNHISYLIEKRNDELEKLIKIGVIPIHENNKSEEDFSKTHDVVMSLEKQIKLSENCLEISKIINFVLLLITVTDIFRFSFLIYTLN